MNWLTNPFWVLGLDRSATLADARRSARKLEQQIQLGSKKASRYESPIGEHERTLELIRQAEHDMENPARRAAFAILAKPVETNNTVNSDSPRDPRVLRWWEGQ